MPDAHARLAPSSAERWIRCPASVRLIEALPPSDDESEYAEEGTDAHTMAELKLRADIDELNLHRQHVLDRWGRDALDEMEEHTNAYAQYVRVAAGERGVLLTEQRLATGVPECWGTSDAVIVGQDWLEIVDLKYGAGIWVDPEDNPQLKLYAAGALDAYGDMIDTTTAVTVTVFQPRVGNVSHWSTTPDELRRWRDDLVLVANEALEGSNRFGPSERSCRWCPVAPDCTARANHVARRDFGDPERLTPAEIAEELPRIAELRRWCGALEARALQLAYTEETPIPGYKVVLRGGRRYVTDHAALIQHLIDEGYTAEQVADFKTKTFGHLEKLVGGRAAFDEIAGRWVGKSEPAPSLVPESEKGTPVSSLTDAQEEFKE